ncbi:MAG: serine/threonine-protein kinase [Gemmatimonadaceae bacterium]
MTRCPACGKTYTDDARFCTRDGSKLVVMPSRDLAEADEHAAPISAATPARNTVAGRAEHPAPVTHGNLTDRVLDGRYRIVRKVGEGGMSFVYLASDVATQERYAIKVLSAALSSDENAMARLRREASLGMRLAHPNVCHIIRLGETQDGLVYVVMPFVEGEVLSDRNNRLGTIPLAEVVPFVRDIAAGLQVAHELKIVHRDLKPENVMICANPSGGERAVVMDFGLAKERRADAELQKLTATGIILGTPEFMSPEQLRGRPLDPRTDIYSLALMTYEMLTGKLPFTGRTQQEMMIARLRSEPMPLRAAAPQLGLPETVERVLAKAMQRDPDDRYTSAPELATALTAAVKGGAIGGEQKSPGRFFGR